MVRVIVETCPLGVICMHDTYVVGESSSARKYVAAIFPLAGKAEPGFPSAHMLGDGVGLKNHDKSQDIYASY